MGNYNDWQGRGSLHTKEPLIAGSPERQRLQRLYSDFATLRREVRQTIAVDLSVATTLTAFFLLASFAGAIVRAHDCDFADFFDYLAYVFPVWAAWIVGLGLYVRNLLFISFKISIALLFAGLMSYFISKGLIAAFVGQWGIFVTAVISLLLMFAPRPKGQPKRSKGLAIFYGVFMTFTMTISIVLAVLFLPKSNEWFRKSLHLIDYQPKNTCEEKAKVDEKHSQHDSASGAL